MKRPRDTPKNASKALKRHKTDQPARTKPPQGKRRKIGLDDVQWKEVSMPDRLEDFEGFYGLEEIDGVDVVKDDETGYMSFVTTKTEEQVAKDREAAKKAEAERDTLLEQQFAKEGELDNEQDEGQNEEQEEDDWEGFSDEEVAVNDATLDAISETAADPPTPAQNGIEKQKKKSKKDKKSAKGEASKVLEETDDIPPSESQGKAQSEEAEENYQGAFDLLADKEMDDDDYEVDVSAWEELELRTETLASLSKLKFSEPTPIQASTIPEIMAGNDVIGKASTGSGKTLAFGIPILESFLADPPASSKDKSPIALIISPTRELAHQLAAHLTVLCSSDDFVGPSIATITGGLSVQKQRRMLEKADIVVGTPGRLWEVISSGQGVVSSFKKIKFLVIDEADRLLSQGHYKELGEILKVLDKDDEEDKGEAQTKAAPESQRQTLVFSATFHKGLQQKLAGKIKRTGDILNAEESMEYLLKKLNFKDPKPRFIDMNPNSQMASGLQEGLIECSGPEKDLYLYSLLMFHPKKRALIFTNSISAVRRLTPFLQNLDVPALPLHSQMPQKSRLRSVERFKQRPGSVLIATDVAARGLDIAGVDLVIHYHLPRAADMYVHRSGRTARASATGFSILICAPEEVAGVRRLVAKVHARSQSASDKDKDKKTSKKPAFFIRTLDIDRRLVSRLKPRATLSKALADTVLAKEKSNSEDNWMRAAAEELGVDYDSETFASEAKGRKGRGSGRKKAEKVAREVGKGEMAAMRAELKAMLAQRVNVGVSERYLTSGGVDVQALLSGAGNGGFLGNVADLGFDDH